MIFKINNRFSIKIYKDFNYELESIWKSFEQNSFHCFFHKIDWVKNWYNTYGKDVLKNKILIIIIYKDNIIYAILPFVIFKFLHINILKWAGYPFSDLNSGLYDKTLSIDQVSFKLIWLNIINNNKIDAVDLINCPENIIKIHNPFVRYLNCKTNIFSYKITTQDNFNDYCLKINLKNHSTFIQNIRKIEKKGKLIFKDIKYDDFCEKKKVIEFFFKHKKKQLLRTKAWNYLNKSYYVNFLDCMFKQDFSKFYSLYLNDELISVIMGYEDKDNKIFYYIFPTYNLEYKKYSAGVIILFNLIKNLVAKNYSLDFTIGNEDYKKKWSNKCENIYYVLKFYTTPGFFYIIYKILYKKLSESIFKKFFKKIYHAYKL